MQFKFPPFLTIIGSAPVLAVFAMAALVDPAYAQSLEDQIGAALKSNVPLTRSLAADPKTVAERQVIDRIRTRSISVEPAAVPSVDERALIADISRDKPAIDLDILFDYDSAEITPKAAPVLMALAAALSRQGPKGSVFLINGHTDAAGRADYNQTLSQRRANAVRRILIEQYKLAPDTLIATGFGAEQLKNTTDPLSAENRRVQIVNTTIQATTGR
ncbi:outer membrane protein OmpA-like peptidoglycan-associated protein [Nitrobacteraceae bacterium AZCC 1564]